MSRIKKTGLLLLAAALFFGASRVQKSLNNDRNQLGLTRVQPLDNAPPVLAFTTVALGGFRGLISNMLWIRANELQEEDKFFEMAQLADWITKLEPHFSTVWTHQAWNMAYNISVKFKQTAPGEYPDRWRWVKSGIELLRDEALKYNPNDVGIHQQLAWIFQHKLGANLDDANMYYKQQWLKETAEALDKHLRVDFESLINPQTEDQKKRAALLVGKYKMDPKLMKEIDETYGPLQWHLPEAHAIYWAVEGMKRAKANPTKINPEDLIQLRRVIYQSMLLSFQRGRLITNSFNASMDLGPNLDIIPNVNKAYEENIAEEDEKDRDHMSNGHRSFLRQAVYSLYVNNRIPEAAKLFKYLGEKYPNKMIIDGDTNSFPRNVTLEQYALSTVQVDINETSRDRVKTAIEGFLVQSYSSLIMGEDDRATGFRLLANKVWEAYRKQMPADRWSAIGLPSVDEISETILRQMLDPETGVPPEARAVLRTQLELPPEAAPAASTNSVNSSSIGK
jgi:hypothetical protein